MARRCDLTGKRPNSANNVSHSHIKTKKKQKWYFIFTLQMVMIDLLE